MSSNMPVEILTLAAAENGTYAIDDIQFLDEDDNAVVPNADTVTWCLTDNDGNVINNREDVALTSALSMTIVLSGDDLEVSGNPERTVKKNYFDIEIYQRRVAIRGEIDSTLGNDLPVTKEFAFNIENIVCL